MIITETYLQPTEVKRAYGSLEQFFMSYQKKAFTVARLSVSNDDEALDIVQDAMEKMVRYYSLKPANEWRALFFRVLHNQIVDWYRKNTVRNKLFFWKSSQSEDDGAEYWENVVCNEVDTPENDVGAMESAVIAQRVLKKLPLRQRQCFMLRQWEGLSTKETANIMGCSEGSVKTHLHRALQAVQQALTGENQ